MKWSLVFFLLVLVSCQSESEKEMIGDCDGLAMKYYRGLPVPSKLYKKHCMVRESELKYTPDKCQKAMHQLTLHGSESRLKKLFGNRIMECFNEGDLKRFQKN